MSALAFVLVTPTQTPPSNENIVTVRGEREHLYHYPPTGPSLNQKVLFIPGVGGWFGWAVTVAERMASWGYDVEGLDTKVYLDGFSRRTALTATDIMSDLHELVEWMTNRSSERITLVGWSEGAGLSVLGATADGNKKVLAGAPATFHDPIHSRPIHAG
jgi:dienelactone hydrolase